MIQFSIPVLFGSKLFQKRLRSICIIVTVFIVTIWLYITAVKHNPYNLFGEMPSMKNLENPDLDISTEVISSDGICLGRYYHDNRSLIQYDEIPSSLVKTLILSEDHRFYQHSGLDFRSYLRVLKGIITFDKQGGGSTLTQQVAKNLFHTRSNELKGRLANLGWPFEITISKTKELLIAIELEQRFTKEEIIAMYLNIVPFHYKTFGIKAAAQLYFNKNLDQLNLPECALLVGMLQGTYSFNPVLFPARAKIKRNEVLNKLHFYQYIKTKKELDSLKRLPLKLDFSPPRSIGTFATHFVHNILKQEMRKWCYENGYDLYESGLKIYVTIDTRIQALAEAAVTKQMRFMQKEFENEKPITRTSGSGKELKGILGRKIKNTFLYKRFISEHKTSIDSLFLKLHEKRKMRIFTLDGERDTILSCIDSIQYYNRFLQSGLMAMNPETGEIKAWVGGINFDLSQYDHVKQGKRQAGSTFKPFVFGVAIESGYSPCFRLPDISPAIQWGHSVYQPKNYDGTYGSGEQYTLRQALARSLNSITMQMAERVTSENIIHFAQRLGITSNLDAVPSIALGTSDVSLFEMVAAYSAFVNNGLYTLPYYVTRIEDRNGNIIRTFAPQQKITLEESTAGALVHMLKGGVEEQGGTSHGLSAAILSDNEVGGKTGTTDDASDGWYIGITHNLVTGVWVGGEEPSIHLPPSLASGSKSALPIWDRFMKEVYAHPETGIMKGAFKKHNADAIPKCEELKSDSVYTIF